MELVPHGQYAVNPYWLSVITSLRILTYRTPEGKPLGHPMPKTSCQSQKRKKNFLEAERTNALPATYCLNLSWLWATHKTVFRGEGTDRLCKSKASKGLGSREWNCEQPGIPFIYASRSRKVQEAQEIIRRPISAQWKIFLIVKAAQ